LKQQTDIAGVRQGDVLAGKYRIDRVLGVGGMGVVVAAHHLQLDDKFAIKFLLPDLLDSPEAVRRFAKEARAAVKIRSEHVARVFDVGTLENEAPYLVMEYLEGEDLAGWLQKQGALPIEQAVGFVLQACEAIAEAHSLGIVHRDLKPANLFCIRQADGQFCIKVLDFGISKMSGPAVMDGDMCLTKTAALMGSPLYMSPEQMESARDVDARTDIWALGVTLYELISGKNPFVRGSLPEACMAIARRSPPPIRVACPDAPADLEQAIFKCLEKDRAHRFENVADLALSLLDYAPHGGRASVEKITRILRTSGLSETALPSPPPESGAQTLRSGGETMPPWGGTASGRKSRQRGTKTVGLVVAAVLLLVIAGGVWARGRRSSSNDVPQTGAASSAISVASSAAALPVAIGPTLIEPPRPLPVPVPAPSAEPAPGLAERSRAPQRPKKASVVASAAPRTAASSVKPSTPVAANPTTGGTAAPPIDDIDRFLADPK
jgi:serine/threonine protein kinase